MRKNISTYKAEEVHPLLTGMERQVEKARDLLDRQNRTIQVLKCERRKNGKILGDSLALLQSRLQEQKSTVNNVRRSYALYRQQLIQDTASLAGSFNHYVSCWKKVEKRWLYQQKLARDQLKTKNLKYKDLDRKYQALLQETDQKKAQEAKEAILNCIHCKALESVRHKLVIDLASQAEKYKKSRIELQTLSTENKRLKENLNSKNRENVELKAKLEDEIKKNAVIKSSPMSAGGQSAAGSSSDCEMIVDIVKTPGNNLSASGCYSPPGRLSALPMNSLGLSRGTSFVNDHTLCDKEKNRLNWLITNKEEQISRLQKEIQEMKDQYQHTCEEMSEIHSEYRSKSESLEVYKMQCDRLTILTDQLKERENILTVQLSKANQVEQELQESKAKNELLQTLLSNLATSVQSMLT
uniref:Uncharacterized protein n=1 Tax=Romanomermis culicivorax TaxID=13658 RepID=A0A915HR58_ROMCU